MPSQKKAPARSSIPKLQSQIDDVCAGRSSSLDLSHYKIDVSLAEIPYEIRGLEGLRALTVGDNTIEKLPGWLGDLPNLERIDVSDRPMPALPYLPRIRWAVDADTIIRCDHLDPAKVYAISVKNGNVIASHREGI